MMTSMMLVETEVLKDYPNLQRNMEMAGQYREGRTLQAVADLHGLTRERVRQILAKQGITLADRGPLQPKRERIEQAAEITAWLTVHGPATRSEVASAFDLEGWELARLEAEGLIPKSQVIADPKGSSNLRFDFDIAVAAARRVWEESGYKDSGRFFSGVTYDEHRGDGDPSRALISIKWSWVKVAEAAGIPTRKKNRVYRKRWTDAQILGWVHGFAVWAEENNQRMTFLAYEQWARRTAGAPCGATVRNQMRERGSGVWTQIILEASRQGKES